LGSMRGWIKRVTNQLTTLVVIVNTGINNVNTNRISMIHFSVEAPELAAKPQGKLPAERIGNRVANHRDVSKMAEKSRMHER